MQSIVQNSLFQNKRGSSHDTQNITSGHSWIQHPERFLSKEDKNQLGNRKYIFIARFSACFHILQHVVAITIFLRRLAQFHAAGQARRAGTRLPSFFG